MDWADAFLLAGAAAPLCIYSDVNLNDLSQPVSLFLLV